MRTLPQPVCLKGASFQTYAVFAGAIAGALREEGFALMKRRTYDLIDKCVRPVALLPVLTMWFLVLTDVLDEYGRWAKFGVFLASFVPYLFGYNTVVRGWLHGRIED